MKNRLRLRLEQLEDRCMPSALGQPWLDPGQLTLSFAPDGTLVNGASSDLFATLNRAAPTSQWQQAIFEAFQAWVPYANVNISLVADGGQPFGTNGSVQGDPRFGDIRIGMAPLPANLVATTAPFSWTGSTWSGDVIFNSRYSFGLGGQGRYDLYTVALHEAGHALGIPDNTSDVNSVMYANYTGPRTGLDSLDISNIQALYGARLDGTNGVMATAINADLALFGPSLTGILPSLLQGTEYTVNHADTWRAPVSYLDQANIVYGGDADYYPLTVPTVSSRTGAYALDAIVWQTAPGGLDPVLHFFDGNGNPVAAQVMADNGSVFSLQLLGVTAGENLSVEVVGQTTQGAGSTGSYVLGIRFNQQPETVAPLLGSDTLASAASTDSGMLAMNQNGVFYFELAAANDSASTSSSVTMTVYGPGGGTVEATLTAATGAAPRTTAVYLPAGTYTIVYSVSATAGAYVPTTYSLSGEILSDPIGPYYSSASPPPCSSSTSTGTIGGNSPTGGSLTSTLSAMTPFTYSGGASVSIATSSGTISVPIPAPGGSWSQSFTTSVGVTTVTLTTDANGNVTLTLTTPSSNTITDTVTTSGSTSTETLTTADGIQVTIVTPVTTPAPTYSGSSSSTNQPYYY